MEQPRTKTFQPGVVIRQSSGQLNVVVIGAAPKKYPKDEWAGSFSSSFLLAKMPGNRSDTLDREVKDAH